MMMCNVNRTRVFLYATLLLFGGACSGGGNSAGSTPLVQPATRPVAGRYVALGASDAVGAGSSSPCLDLLCTGGKGYAPIIVRLAAVDHISLTLTDLGIGGALAGPAMMALSRRYGAPSTFPACGLNLNSYTHSIDGDEVSSIPADATHITLVTGPNDVSALTNDVLCSLSSGASSESALISAESVAFAQDVASMIARIRQRAPAARLVVVNVPNVAAFPWASGLTPRARQVMQDVVNELDDRVIDPLTAQGFTVVDVRCDAALYATSNFSSDGYHLNDAGYAYAASRIEPILLGAQPPAPASTCAQALAAS